MSTTYPSPVELVLEFHRTYGQAIRTEPTLDVPERKMRVALVVEEMDEYRHAEATNDLIEIADALGDLIYVAAGAAITHGLEVPEKYLDIRAHGLLANGPFVPTLDIENRKTWVEYTQQAVNAYVKAEAEDFLSGVQAALGNIIATAYAAARAHGINLDHVLEEIQASNMSKLDPATGKPIYREDGKVLKGSAFFAPNIERVLGEQGMRPTTI
jgi:predicted HAD superfamily Cof-like phosphohydrolase